MVSLAGRRKSRSFASQERGKEVEVPGVAGEMKIQPRRGADC